MLGSARVGKALALDHELGVYELIHHSGSPFDNYLFKIIRISSDGLNFIILRLRVSLGSPVAMLRTVLLSPYSRRESAKALLI
jgi:hypothetical protein